jgi:hypothetical protein
LDGNQVYGAGSKFVALDVRPARRDNVLEIEEMYKYKLVFLVIVTAILVTEMVKAQPQEDPTLTNIFVSPISPVSPMWRVFLPVVFDESGVGIE